MAESPVHLHKKGNITIISLDDGKANVFGFALIEALDAALDEIDTREGAVVIEGREGIYSGGFDLAVAKGDSPADMGRLIFGRVNVALKAFDFPRPIVAAVTGHAIAMGAIFNTGLDWRIGARGPFRHGLNEVRAGLVLPIFALEMPRFRINPSIYQEATMQSRIFSPEEAVEAGFLDEVVDADKVRDAALAKAQDLAALPNPAYCVSKKRDRAQVKKYVSETLESDLFQVMQEIMGY